MGSVPGTPARWRGRLVERDRWEWRAGDGGDPIGHLVEFLGSHYLAVDDLARPPGGQPGNRPGGQPGDRPGGPRAGRPGAAVGAALLLGGAIGPIGPAGQVGPAGPPMAAAAPSPCPGVPDAVAVVYDLADTFTPARGPGLPAPAAAASPALARAGTPPYRLGEWVPSWSPAEHAAAVEAVRAAIACGDLYQANLVGHRSAPFEGDPEALGAALAGLPDAPYAGGLSGAGWAVHTASPELFLEARGGVARTRPIKGTAVRHPGPAADAAARAALRASPKDRAEHVMIVDLERNDLGRVAVTGGVRVGELYEVRALSGLWHAESVVEARLRPGTGLGDLLSATFPGGSVTGAPKLAALAEIARHEPVGRGPSMGALGWVGAGGELTLSLTIRTVAVTGGRAHLWTGGGITWGSDPAAEVAEAEAKAAPLLAALDAFATRR